MTDAAGDVAADDAAGAKVPSPARTALLVVGLVAVAGAVEAVHYEPRDDAELRRFDDLRAEVADELEDRGLGDLADRLDENLFRVGIDARTPPEISTEISALMDLGLPTAVFVAPPDAG